MAYSSHGGKSSLLVGQVDQEDLLPLEDHLDLWHLEFQEDPEDQKFP